MATLKIRNASNTGWIDAGTKTLSFRNSGNSGWVNKVNLADVRVRNAANTDWITFVTQPPGPVAPTQLSLLQNNDLDFYLLPTQTNPAPTAFTEIICTVNAGQFFSNATGATFEHIAFVIDAAGEQGTNNPHCGPIIRNGSNLWSVGRGFIIFANGSIQAEQWNGTFSPGFLNIQNEAAGTFDPNVGIWTVRILAGYRDGQFAEQMRIFIHSGDSISGPVIFNGTAPGWGWDRLGTFKGGVAIIADGFVKPADTGCIEVLANRSSPNARIFFSNFALNVRTSL